MRVLSLLRANGAIVCWGPGVWLDWDTNAVSIAVGKTITCALLANGEVSCWGRLVPVPDAVTLTAGQDHICALRAGGQVACWGEGDVGQLGQGALEDSADAVGVMSLADAVAVGAGGLHTCARRAGGGVVCWGNVAASGAIGDGVTSSRPVAVTTLDGP